MTTDGGYIPAGEPFWTDGEFRVYEISEGHFMACRINGAVHFRGTLRSCATWIERERDKVHGN